MPQFDIASFYPQIIYLAGISIGIYLIVTKNTLPKISQNLKINKKIIQMLESGKGMKDMNILSNIYNPKEMIKQAIYKESLSIIYLKKEIKTIVTAYIASIKWLNKTNEINKKIKMEKINKIYMKMINETQ